MKKPILQLIMVYVLVLAGKTASADNIADIKKVTAACIMTASKTYSVSPQVLVGVYDAENGEIGKTYEEDGQTFLGIMKINSDLIPLLAEKWGMEEKTAKESVLNDPCTNIGIAAFNLHKALESSQNIKSAIAKYAIQNRKVTLEQGEEYSRNVIDVMERKGLLKMEDAASKTVSEKTWLLLIYDWQTMIKNPKPMPSLDACLEAAKNLYMGNTRWRYQCLEPVSGALYSGVTGALSRKKWDTDLPKSVQMGRKAPWLD